MTDIVERLRSSEHPGCREAADEIERLRQACDGYLGELAAMRKNKDAEIERLRERVAELEKKCLCAREASP